MALKYLSNIDLGGLEIQNAKPFVITTADQTALANPSHASYLGTTSAHQGQMYFNSQTKALLLWKGTGFIVLDGSGDISRINITAGNGLTGDLDTTAGDHIQTITVVGGDGITANADEIEVTVDNSTIELSASTGAGAVRIKDGGVATAKLASNAVTTIKITDANVTTAKIADSNVTTGKIADNAVTLAKLAHQTNNTVFKVNGTGVPIAGTIDTINITADAVDGTKIADNAIDSEHYTDGSIDHEHLAGDVIDGDNIADDVVDSEHYVAGSIDTEHIAADQVTFAKVQNVGTARILGRVTAGSGDVEELTAANHRPFLKSALGGAFGSSALSIGTNADTVTIPGNLVVTGDTTYSNETVKVVEDNTIEFEGTTADDAHQIKLSGGDPTADRTVTLPDNSGTIALTTDITARQFSTLIGNASAATINILNSGASAPHKNHGLGADSTSFMIQLIEVSSGATVLSDIVRGASGAVAVTFAVAPAANAVRVLINKIG
jgi:hypothetical protein